MSSKNNNQKNPGKGFLIRRTSEYIDWLAVFLDPIYVDGYEVVGDHEFIRITHLPNKLTPILKESEVFLSSLT